jgi:hypothetical protein
VQVPEVRPAKTCVLRYVGGEARANTIRPRSRCLKLYCDCFQAGNNCLPECGCQ